MWKSNHALLLIGGNKIHGCKLNAAMHYFLSHDRREHKSNVSFKSRTLRLCGRYNKCDVGVMYCVRVDGLVAAPSTCMYNMLSMGFR